MTQKDKEMAEIAQIMLSLSAKYAYKDGPKNLIAEARRVYEERNGIVRKKKNHKKFESHGPIHTAMMNLAQAKRKIEITSLAVSKAASKFIDKGMLRYDDFYKGKTDQSRNTLENMKASHFVDDALLTLACVENTAAEHDISKSTWKFKSGMLKNREVVKGEMYVPYADRVVIGIEDDVSDIPPAVVANNQPNDLLIKRLKNIQHFDGDLKTDFQFVSLILAAMPVDASGKLNRFINMYITDKAASTTIINAIVGILSETPKFGFHEPDVKSFDTMHYTTSLCHVNGWYDINIGDKAYKIEISRKMVIASLKKTDDNVLPCNIPLCEEVMFQIRYKTLGDLEGTYCPIGFFISASAGKTGALHFLGDNAISVHMPCRLGISADRDGDIMIQGGKLIKHLQSIHLPGLASVTHGKFFFEKLFKVDENGAFDRNDKLVRHCVSRIKEQHAKNGITKSETDISDIDIVKASFVANQHAFDLTKVDEYKSHHTRLWETSKSFSMMVMSPPNDPNLNYVFVLIQDENGVVVPEAFERNVTSKKIAVPRKIDDNIDQNIAADEIDPGDEISTPRMREFERGAIEMNDTGKYGGAVKTDIKTKFYESTLPLDLESELARL